jgi:cell division protein ZapA
MSENLVAVTILDRTYQIKCLPEEAAQLQEAANYLNNHMRKMNQSSQSLNTERLAIVAALNITHELMIVKNQKMSYIDVMHDQIKMLQQRVEKFIGTREEVPV